MTRFFKFKLRDADLPLTEFDNLKLGVDVGDRLFNFEKSITNLSDVNNRIHRTIDDYNPQTKSAYEDKKSS